MHKLLIIALIVSFGVLTTPRDFWHECDHQVSQNEHDDDDLSMESDCHACDFNLCQALLPVDFSFELKPNKHYFYSEVICRVDLHSIVNQNKLRGPPVM